MPRTLGEAKVTTPNARRTLSRGLHWYEVAPQDIHLGYRKGKRGGRWLARWRVGKSYRQEQLGAADDAVCEGTLSHKQAVEAARKLVEERRRQARAQFDGPAITVAHATRKYMEFRDERDSRRRGRAVRSDASSRLGRYVVGVANRGKREEVAPSSIANVALAELTDRDLAEWREALPSSLKAATKQRLINDLKAALNGAIDVYHDRLPPNLPDTIKRGLRMSFNNNDDEIDQVARANQILTDAEVGSLIGAARDVDEEQGWQGDLFRMVVVLAATGARFSQVARLRVRDVQAERLIIPVSRKGRGKKPIGTPVPVGVDVRAALVPAITGRSKEAALLERNRSKQVPGTIRWERAGRGPWQSSSELNRAWAAVRARAKLPQAIPYSFRHSSIVRGIRANLPIRLVAALHDTSVAMIERHYGRWVADGLDELAARSVVPLVPEPKANTSQKS